MTSYVEIDDPSCYLLFPDATANRQRIRLRPIKFLAVGYSSLLSWQLVGTCLYMNRAIACFKKGQTPYDCDSNIPLPYSDILIIAWVVNLSFLNAVLISALRHVPSFPGYKVIFHRLKFVPSFWTLVLLLLLCLSRYAELILSSKSSIPVLTLAGLAVSYILRIAAVGFLNYTQLNLLKPCWPTYIFVLSKLTLFLLFFICLTNLLATLLAVTVEVHSFRQSVGEEFSISLKMINELLSDFGQTTFRFKLMNFFWQKLFIDDRNILCNHTYLPWVWIDDRKRKGCLKLESHWTWHEWPGQIDSNDTMWSDNGVQIKSSLLTQVGPFPRDPHIKRTGFVTRNFEKNPKILFYGRGVTEFFLTQRETNTRTLFSVTFFRLNSLKSSPRSCRCRHFEAEHPKRY